MLNLEFRVLSLDVRVCMKFKFRVLSLEFIIRV